MRAVSIGKVASYSPFQQLVMDRNHYLSSASLGKTHIERQDFSHFSHLIENQTCSGNLVERPFIELDRIDLEHTIPAGITEDLPIVVPEVTITLLQIQTPGSITTGSVIRAISRRKSCDPVVIKVS